MTRATCVSQAAETSEENICWLFHFTFWILISCPSKRNRYLDASQNTFTHCAGQTLVSGGFELGAKVDDNVHGGRSSTGCQFYDVTDTRRKSWRLWHGTDGPLMALLATSWLLRLVVFSSWFSEVILKIAASIDDIRSIENDATK